MDPRAVPLPVRSRRSETKCLRHCYSAPGCPLAAALWSIPQVREPTRVARNPLFCSEPIQHHRHQDTFYLPQELLPDPFKETHQHDTVLTKMSPGTYLRDVLHDFFNFIVVCSSAQMTPFIMFWWLELNMVFCYHNDEDSKFGTFFFNFFWWWGVSWLQRSIQRLPSTLISSPPPKIWCQSLTSNKQHVNLRSNQNISPTFPLLRFVFKFQFVASLY